LAFLAAAAAVSPVFSASASMVSTATAALVIWLMLSFLSSIFCQGVAAVHAEYLRTGVQYHTTVGILCSQNAIEYKIG
jgi:hypothetical protein